MVISVDSLTLISPTFYNEMLSPLATITTCTFGGVIVGQFHDRASQTSTVIRAATKSSRRNPNETAKLEKKIHRPPRLQNRFAQAAGLKSTSSPSASASTSARIVKSLPVSWGVCCFAFATSYELGKAICRITCEDFILGQVEPVNRFASNVMEGGIGGGLAGLTATRLKLPFQVVAKTPLTLIGFGVGFGLVGGMATFAVGSAQEFLGVYEEEVVKVVVEEEEEVKVDYEDKIDYSTELQSEKTKTWKDSRWVRWIFR